jgi:hypothetical protein
MHWQASTTFHDLPRPSFGPRRWQVPTYVIDCLSLCNATQGILTTHQTQPGPNAVRTSFVIIQHCCYHLSCRHDIAQSPASQGSTLHTWPLSLHLADAHNTPSRPCLFHWVRNRLSASTSSVDIELPEHSKSITHVPHAKSKYVSSYLLRCSFLLYLPLRMFEPHLTSRRARRERRRPLIPKKRYCRSLTASNSIVTRSSSQPHAAVSAPPPAVANTTIRIATIKIRWLLDLFWLFICCTSSAIYVFSPHMVEVYRILDVSTRTSCGAHSCTIAL